MLRKLSGDKQFELLLAKQLAEPPADWYSCTIYTSLHTRPVVLSMMREWLLHRLSAAGRAPAEFEADLAATRDAATIRLALPYIVGETQDRLALASFVASGLADDIGYGTAMTSHLLTGRSASRLCRPRRKSWRTRGSRLRLS